jgi:hypothetical protein
MMIVVNPRFLSLRFEARLVYSVVEQWGRRTDPCRKRRRRLALAAGGLFPGDLVELQGDHPSTPAARGVAVDIIQVLGGLVMR